MVEEEKNTSSIIEGAVVSLDVAEKEIQKWLDFRKVSFARRAICNMSIKHLVFAIMEGDLVLNEDFSFVQKLKFPIGDTKEFVYKPRISVDEIQSRLIQANLKENDRIGETYCYAAALTGNTIGITRKLDSEDFRIADHLCFFFMG